MKKQIVRETEYFRITTVVQTPHLQIDCLKAKSSRVRSKVIFFHHDANGYVVNTIQLTEPADMKPFFDMIEGEDA